MDAGVLMVNFYPVVMSGERFLQSALATRMDARIDQNHLRRPEWTGSYAVSVAVRVKEARSKGRRK